jgi:hypothetical protein
MPSDSHLIKTFETYQKRRKLTPGTMETRCRNLSRTHEALGSFRDLTPGRLQDWFREQGYTPNTIRAYYEALRAFFLWAVPDYIELNPIANFVQPPPAPAAQRLIASDDVLLALNSAKGHVRLWIALAAFQGLGCKEIASLTREHLDLRARPPRLLASPQDRTTGSLLRDQVREALDGLTLPSTGYLVPSATESSVSQRINRFLHRQLGIDATAMSLVWWYREQVQQLTSNSPDIASFPYSESPVLQAKVVTPVQRLLSSRAELGAVEVAYQKALNETSPDDAITDAGTALQEMLTALDCTGNALGPLISSARKRGLLGAHDSPLVDGLERIMNWVSADRSSLGDGHRGKSGATAEDAALIVHVVGALILRLTKGPRPPN